MNYDFTKWHDATGSLPWGAQTVIKDTLSLVANDQVKLVHGTNFVDGSPCLINAASNMVKMKGSPIASFPDVVEEFDNINRHLKEKGVNTDASFVSPLAAEILLANFGPEREKPVESAVNEATQVAAFEEGTYREPTDEELTRSWLETIATDAEPEPIYEEPEPEELYLDLDRERINGDA